MKVIVVICSIMLLCGCVEEIKDGIVSGKEHSQAYSTTSMVMSGKTPVPITTFHPEAYYVTIYKIVKHERTVCVTEEEYSKYRIGDTVEVE